LRTRSPGAFWSTAAVVVAFGVAMGYLEAAVVVYLRAAVGIVPSAVPAHDPKMFGAFEAVETVRELTTLVMIAAVGWLAGRTRLERLAWAAVVFGAWDIVYYLGLRQVIGWPPDLATLGRLFLVPVPWVGPVWAPIAVSAVLVGFGLAAARRLRAGLLIVVGRARAMAALAGGGLVIASFVVDTDRALAGDTSAWSGWPLFWAGMALAVGATAGALGALRITPTRRGGRLRDGSGRRHQAGSPD
jgi:hypothetical protein